MTVTETQIASLRASLTQSKAAYLASVAQRSQSQRELNDLLQRKHLWTTTDVERFTSLVREDHSVLRDEERAKAEMDEGERAVERGFTELMNAILK